MARGSADGNNSPVRGRRRRTRARAWRPTPTRAAGFLRLAQDLVVDIGDVADEQDVVAGVRQPAPQDIECDAAADVADVRHTLHGRPTQVDGHAAVGQGREVADLAGRGVVDRRRVTTCDPPVGYQRGRDGGDPLAAPGQTEPVGRRRRDRYRRSQRRGQYAREASSRRGPIFGRFPITCTDPLTTTRSGFPHQLGDMLEHPGT